MADKSIAPYLWENVVNKLGESANVKDFGAVGDGVTDDTTAIQNAMDEGGNIYFPSGTYMVSSLELKSSTYLEGEGYDIVTIKQIAGSNTDLIYSDGDISKCGIKLLTLDGNYFDGAWNDAVGVTNNTSGNGLTLQAYSCVIDIVINNVAGIGAYFMEPDASQSSSISEYISTVSIVGRDYGQEGIVIEGPNDWILQKAWIGRAGILPRPTADTNFATSTLYGDTVDGIVINGANIEIGDVHVYACWSGTGFKTLNTVRLTKGGRVISESNNAQVELSESTYGSGFFDVRNLSLYHPNWSTTEPSYTYPDSRWDAVTINANDFEADVTIKRTITATTRVVGTAGLVTNGTAKVDVTYSNSNAPSGDTEYGSLYSGDAVNVYGSGNINASVDRCNGKAVAIYSEGGNITCNVGRTVGTGIYRTSISNSKRGNIITGSVLDSDIGFESEGTPMSEVVNIAMELTGTDIPFSGDEPDLGRGQIWNISASVDNVETSTYKVYKGTLDSTATTDQAVLFDHDFLYTPRLQECQISVIREDGNSPARLDYIGIESVSATQVRVAYKFGTADATPSGPFGVVLKIG